MCVLARQNGERKGWLSLVFLVTPNDPFARVQKVHELFQVRKSLCNSAPILSYVLVRVSARCIRRQRPARIRGFRGFAARSRNPQHKFQKEENAEDQLEVRPHCVDVLLLELVVVPIGKIFLERATKATQEAGAFIGIIQALPALAEGNSTEVIVGHELLGHVILRKRRLACRPRGGLGDGGEELGFVRLRLRPFTRFRGTRDVDQESPVRERVAIVLNFLQAAADPFPS